MVELDCSGACWHGVIERIVSAAFTIRLVAILYVLRMPKTLFVLIVLAIGSPLTARAPLAAETQDTARRAVERGELMPLSKILGRVEQEFPGRVVEVELERRGGRFVYEIEVLQQGGRVVKLVYDGRTGERLASEPEDAD